MIMSVAHVAHALTEQSEVTEFLAKGIDPVCLWSTVALSWRLLTHADCAPSQENGSRVQRWSTDRAEMFLEIWECFVYPVLKAPENKEWAEKWRGGHITNYVDLTGSFNNVNMIRSWCPPLVGVCQHEVGMD